MPDPREVIRNINELPTLPSVVAKVNELVNSSNASAGDINDVISRDISLSSRVLKLVNSSFYGFPRRITSITHAVVILGFNTVRNLVLSSFVFSAFKQRSARFDHSSFWTHSVGTAVGASTIAQAANLSQNQREDAFIAGLLHDVGKVVMCEFMSDSMDEVLSRVEQQNCLFLDAEHQTLDFDHSELGGCLLEEWNLPPSIVGLVRHHHDLACDDETMRMCAIIQLADILARTLCFGNGGDQKMPTLDNRAWQVLDISWDDVGTIMDQSLAEIQRANVFLDLL